MRMRDSGWTRRVVAGLVLIAGPALAGGAVGYAQATGYFKQESRPTLYQPLGLLDARDATAWCSTSSDPLNDLLTFGFDGPVTIEELKISTGNNFDDGTFQSFARAKKLRLKSGKQSKTFDVEDTRGLQTVSLSPPMVGVRFTLEVLDQYPAEDPDQPVCLTDVVFIDAGKPLNGAWMTTKLKYDKHVAQVMGTWFSGHDNTPDRFLSFNYDGTFRYSFEPFDTTRAKEKVVEGKYDVGAGRLTVTIGGKKYALKYSKDPGKKGFVLKLEGDLPEDFKGEWRSQP
ncbi:MAG: hypothetical protein AB1938_00895 [Myxococcota bacterium]